MAARATPFVTGRATIVRAASKFIKIITMLFMFKSDKLWHMTTVRDELQFLSRSPNRFEALMVIHNSRAVDSYRLEEELGVSRRTVSRLLDDLEERMYIHEQSEGWQLTTFGMHVLETYNWFDDTLSLTIEFRPLLARLDTSEVRLTVDHLRGATLTVATEFSPYAALDRVTELRRQAKRIRLVSPRVEKRSIDQLIERVRQNDVIEFDVVLPAHSLETLSQPAFENGLTTLTESERVSARIYPGPLPCFFGVMGEISAIGVSENNKPHALVESKSRDFRALVGEKIDSFWCESERLSHYR